MDEKKSGELYTIIVIYMIVNEQKNEVEKFVIARRIQVTNDNQLNISTNWLVVKHNFSWFLIIWLR